MNPRPRLARLLVAGVKSVVDGAEVRPRLRHGVGGLDVGDVLSHDDGEACLEVEVDVAVEEPRARVVRLEADGDVVACLRSTSADDVTPDGVVVVVDRAARAAYDSKDVLEQVLA